MPDNDPQPWFFGYSVGRWEGDTFVVETMGFKDGGWLDINGSPLSDKGRTIERFRRPTYGTIEIEQTIDDPVNYTRPFTTRLTWRLMPDTEIMEMVCTENNQSINHLVGKDGPAKPATPETTGSLRADSATFGATLWSVIIILGLLMFAPVAVLGPIAEHLALQ